MKGRGIIFKIGNRCVVIAKDEKKRDNETSKSTAADVAKAAINGIYNDSTRTDNEYYITRHAERIYKIAKKSPAPSVRIHAIDVLDKVSGRLKNGYYINRISELKENLSN